MNSITTTGRLAAIGTTISTVTITIIACFTLLDDAIATVGQGAVCCTAIIVHVIAVIAVLIAGLPKGHVESKDPITASGRDAR
tara:strand:+ start:1169 stop:1417 length:249 start_codon:yes stop_codon:yes gene_type:complete